MKTKLEVGQKVRLKRPDLFGQVNGKITEIEKVYQAVNEDGTWDKKGLATLESTINCIQHPHEIKGDMLIVHYPERIFGEITMKGKTEVSKFKYFAYTVRTSKMAGIYNQRHFA